MRDQLIYVSKKVGKAIADYEMLAQGDKILVAISGGKDSLSLLRLMKYRQEFVPIEFEMLAVFVDFGIEGYPIEGLKKYIEQLGVPLHIERTEFFKDKTWDDVDCFLCSWERRKVLFQLADRLSFNKVALGHHMDDIAETILLNLFHNAEIGAMCPKQELFKGKVTIIRPLAYVMEREIEKLRDTEKIPTFDKYKCPHNATSQRKVMKDIIAKVEEVNPDAKRNVVKALKNVKAEYLP